MDPPPAFVERSSAPRPRHDRRTHAVRQRRNGVTGGTFLAACWGRCRTGARCSCPCSLIQLTRRESLLVGAGGRPAGSAQPRLGLLELEASESHRRARAVPRRLRHYPKANPRGPAGLVRCTYTLGRRAGRHSVAGLIPLRCHIQNTVDTAGPATRAVLERYSSGPGTREVPDPRNLSLASTSAQTRSPESRTPHPSAPACRSYIVDSRDRGVATRSKETSGGPEGARRVGHL